MGLQGSIALLVVLCGFFALSSAGFFTINTVSDPVDVGTWSPWFFIVANEAPNSTTSLTMREVDTNNVEFSTTRADFSPTVQSQSFRCKANKAGQYVFAFDKTGDSVGQFLDVASISITFVLRSISIDSFARPVYIGQPSEPMKLYIETPSTSDLTCTPTSDDPSITFSSITIPAGGLSASFTYLATKVVGPTYVAWSCTGGEISMYYQDPLSASYPFQIIKRPVTIPSFTGKALLNKESTDLHVYTRQAVNQTVIVTPQAADTTFSPESFEFGPNNQVARFTFKTITPSSSKSVFFYLSGDGKDYYADINPITINAPKRTISVVTPTSFVLTNGSCMSIALKAPAASALTVSFFASNLKFNVSSVTFSGNQTSFAVDIQPINLGPDTISFLITGDGADLYDIISDINVGVVGGTFFGPANWYIPSLWVGQESDKIPIRASFSPHDSVNLTLSAPDVKFNPPTLFFRNGTEQQYFTITPQYTNNDVDYNSITVSFLVTGPDHTYFATPAPFTIRVQRRSIQMRWSAHLNDNSRHLNKEYKVWASANYVSNTDLVSVTPVSPFFRFKPAVLHFNSRTTRILYTATPIGVVGPTQITYIIGGRDGGWYNPIATDFLSTQIRPLYLAKAVLAPDNRPHGQLFYSPSAAELAANHIYSFALWSTVLPDEGLTITPRCAHATFSPSSITVKGKDAVEEIEQVKYIRSVPFNISGLFLEANFTVKPQASGLHAVWFELSGKDANYYDRPDYTMFNLNQVLRASSEPAQGAAAHLLPSLAAVVACVAFLFM